MAAKRECSVVVRLENLDVVDADYFLGYLSSTKKVVRHRARVGDSTISQVDRA